MLTKEEARYRVLEYIVECISPEMMAQTDFITDLSDADEDPELLRQALKDVSDELTAEMEKYG